MLEMTFSLIWKRSGRRRRILLKRPRSSLPLLKAWGTKNLEECRRVDQQSKFPSKRRFLPNQVSRTVSWLLPARHWRVSVSLFRKKRKGSLSWYLSRKRFLRFKAENNGKHRNLTIWRSITNSEPGLSTSSRRWTQSPKYTRRYLNWRNRWLWQNWRGRDWWWTRRRGKW